MSFIGDFIELFDKNDDFSIGLFGPNGIGKTTLIAAMIEEFKAFSRDAERKNSLRLKLKGADENTNRKLSTRINDLKSGIGMGVFTTGTLTATAEHEEYKLKFEVEGRFDKNFIMHDFPGEWLNNPGKLEQLDVASWNVCILPVDACVIMECHERRYEQKMRVNLGIAQIEEFVSDWLSKRGSNPGLFIIAPVKCESYFDKPAVSLLASDKSLLLFNKVRECYKGVLDAVKDKKNIKGLYMPVNTVGCCYLKKPSWTKDGEFMGEFAISPMKGNNNWRPFGPVYIMFAICQFIRHCFNNGKYLSSRVEAFCRAVDTLEKLVDERDTEQRYERTIILQ